MKAFRKSTLLFVSLLSFLPKRTAQACGFYVWPGEYRFWLLQPDLTAEADLTPFFFASTYLYKQDINAAKETYVQENINQWYHQTDGKASKADIDSFLNATNPEAFFDRQRDFERHNSLLQYALQPENRELYRYLVLSKKVEQVAANPDPWEEEAHPIASINNVISEAKVLHASAQSAFVKLRTAFQLVRLYNYNGQTQALNQTYNAWIEPAKTNSWVKTAALYQKAITTTGTEGDYLLSKVFDRGGYNRTHCLVRFNADSFDAILPLAKNRHERTVLQAMKVFNDPGKSLNAIEQLYAREPAYKELPFLLLREINKVEDWLVTTQVTDFETPAVYGTDFWENKYSEQAAANYRNDKAYAKELYAFLQRTIVENKNKPKILLHLYAAHLALLNKDYEASSHHLERAAAQKVTSVKERTQLAVSRFLLQLEKGFDKGAEAAFMRIMLTPNEKLGVYDAGILKNQLVLYTARKMMQKGDRGKGLLLLSKTNRALGELPIGAYKGLYQEMEERADEGDYNVMLNIFDKKAKTTFERFVCAKKIHTPLDNYEWYEDSTAAALSRNKLLDCKVSWYLRQHRLKEAYATAQKLPAGFYEQSPYTDYIGGDPFFLNVHSAHDISRQDKQSLNKKEVIEEMLRVERLAKKNKSKEAECYFRLANAWYNMTWYGKNWLMVKQWWSINEPGDAYGYVRQTPFNDDYYGCQQAQACYEKAMQTTGDKKLKALCFFMWEECGRNYDYYIKRVKRMKDADYRYGANYIRAKRKGIDEGYYKAIVEECETYQSFIGQYNKRF